MIKKITLIIIECLLLTFTINMMIGDVNADTIDYYKINIESDFNDPTKPKFSSSSSKESNAYDLYEAQAVYNVLLASEGITLMENKNNFLPMTKNSTHNNKISIFGKKSTNYSYGPLGAGDSTKYSLLPCGYQSAWAPSEEVTIYESFSGLDTYGSSASDIIKKTSYVYPQELLSQSFEINPTLVNFYNDDTKSPSDEITLGSGGGELNNYKAGLPVGETPVKYYTDDIKDSFENYNDAAIVLINRVAAEGSDVPKTMLNNWEGKDSSFYCDDNKISGARNWDDHYLQLDENEVAMLQMVMDNFDNIIILCNTNSQFELGFMDDPGHYLFSDNDYAKTYEEKVAAMNKLKAAMFIGYPGTFGAVAIPLIMDGTINPSGHLSDTWMRDFKLDPTWQNQGYGEVVSGCSTSVSNKTSWNNNFVHYDEDIYLGYRYYETRYIEESIYHEDNFQTSGNTKTNNGSITDQSFSTSTTKWNDWYSAQVVYPFGYGLSYTTFEWQDISIKTNAKNNALLKDGVITAEVTVKNTGKVAGKEVVQLYFSAPYYDGQIQKSHVVLGGFAKTGIIEPNSSEKITITMPVEYMKSYDWCDANNNGFKGYEMDYGDYKITLAHDSHDAAKLNEDTTVTFTLGKDINDNLLFRNDLQTGTEVVNHFDYVSGTGFVNEDAKFKGVKQYMLRSNFSGTWPTHTTEKKAYYVANKITQNEANSKMSEERDLNSPWYSDIEYPNQAKTSGTQVTNNIKLWQLAGRDKDDPLWEVFLDQLTPKEMAEFVGVCNYKTAAIDSIDKPVVKDNDGSLGVKACVSIQWPSNPIIAQTFNNDLTYKQGRLFANSAHFQKDGNAQGGIYGTGIETHRSPFAGRNAEYYSEDPILSGIMCAPFMHGANDVGVFLTLKHFGLNNCDTMRGSMCTWASEQAIREIYVKAYEIVVKEGYTTALMSAVDLIGDIGAITNYPLLTALLRKEWGFDGFVISDMTARDKDYTIRAGNDLLLLGTPNIPSYNEASLTTTQLHALRTATKNVMYVYANSQCMNGLGGERLSNYVYTGVTKLYATENVSTSLDIATSSIKTLYSNTNYNSQLYTLAEGSKLPEGLTLNSNGTISGQAKTPGNYAFTIVISEDIPEANVISDEMVGSKKLETVAFPYKDISVNFTLNVQSVDDLPEGIIYSTTELPDAMYGFEYNENIATGGYYVDGVMHNDLVYRLQDNQLLPKGLSLNENGNLTGVCTDAPGLYHFSIVASTVDNTLSEKVVDFILNIKSNTLSYEAKELNNVEINSSVNLSIADGISSSGQIVSYSLKTGDTLPKGLTLSSNGIITGVAEEACTDYEFRVVATSYGCQPVEATYILTVNGLVFSNQTFTKQIYGRKYAYQLHGYFNNSNETTPITYALKDNSYLPTGFNLTSDGKLTGTALDVGNISFVVVCSAEGYNSSEAIITLNTIDLETDNPSGEISKPVDFEEINTQLNNKAEAIQASKTNELNSSKTTQIITISGVAFGIVVLGLVLAFIIIKRKKMERK